MRLRHIPGAAEFVSAHPLVWDEQTAPAQRGYWRKLFGGENRSLYLEIGMGRGKFLLESAQNDPISCYIGLELQEEMIMEAITRMDDCDSLPDNLLFLHMNAWHLTEVFAPGELNGIFINFPDPWPKNRHAKRRLTTVPLLQIYRELLMDGGEVRFKTDGQALFEWSLLNFHSVGFIIEESSIDLPLERSGVITEYERRYRMKGQPIFFLRAVK